MTVPTTVSDLYPRQWLRADDLPPAGARVTVARVEIRTFRRPGGEEPAAVVSFEAGVKPCERKLIANKTQCGALAKLAGSEAFADWVGAEVLLSPATAPNGKATIHVGPAAVPDT